MDNVTKIHVIVLDAKILKKLFSQLFKETKIQKKIFLFFENNFCTFLKTPYRHFSSVNSATIDL